MRQGQAPRVAASRDDADLVRRAQERDGGTFCTIMQRHNRRLYRLARSILRNDREAEDVVQDAYVRAFTHIETFRGDSSLATWLARITMNEALGRLKRQRPAVDWTTLETHRTEAQIIQFPQSTTSEDPERTLAQREILHLVEQAIEDLPEVLSHRTHNARHRGDER
jgi:RNA polymerase sigma-70 factor (ECF subfamily)